MNETILVVDDDDAVRSSIKFLLDLEHYSVITAENGRDALSKFHAVKPDLVITDLIMPEQEGIETIIALRKIWPYGAVIAMSGGGRIGSIDILLMAQGLGADFTIVKPFDPNELLGLVKRSLGLSVTSTA